MIALRLPFPDIGPNIVAIDIAGREFALRWYAMAYIVGILIGWFIVTRLVKRVKLWPKSKAPITSDQVSDLVTWIILGVVLGGRLGYVLFYQPGYFIANPGEILQVWQGGMSFHGGALGVLLWGRPSELPWAVIFPGDAAQACATVDRLCARHPSQLYEALLEGLILGCVMLWLVYRRGWLKTPGAMIGTFLAGYGLGRFIVEFFRQPDAQFTSETNLMGFALQFSEGTGLTMGQLLSTPMIIVGALIILAARRKVT